MLHARSFEACYGPGARPLIGKACLCCAPLLHRRDGTLCCTMRCCCCAGTLSLLDAVVREVLRLHPTFGCVLTREATKHITLGNFKVRISVCTCLRQHALHECMRLLRGNSCEVLLQGSTALQGVATRQRSTGRCYKAVQHSTGRCYKAAQHWALLQGSAAQHWALLQGSTALRGVATRQRSTALRGVATRQRSTALGVATRQHSTARCCYKAARHWARELTV